jgi:hypothetical protein
MAQGFGMIVTKDKKYLFSEVTNKDIGMSHSTILNRSGIKENGDEFLRNFIRVEFFDWTEESFQFDEEVSLPGWAEEDKEEIKNACIKIMTRVKNRIYNDHLSSILSRGVSYTIMKFSLSKNNVLAETLYRFIGKDILLHLLKKRNRRLIKNIEGFC